MTKYEEHYKHHKEMMEHLAQKLIGLEINEAREQAKEDGYELRVIKFDGQPSVITHDHNINRLNVEIKNHIIIGFDGIG